MLMGRLQSTDEMIEAAGRRLVEAEICKPGEGAIMVSGKFEVLEEDPSGMYYRMTEAELVERFEDIRWTGQLNQ